MRFSRSWAWHTDEIVYRTFRNHGGRFFPIRVDRRTLKSRIANLHFFDTPTVEIPQPETCSILLLTGVIGEESNRFPINKEGIIPKIVFSREGMGLIHSIQVIDGEFYKKNFRKLFL